MLKFLSRKQNPKATNVSIGVFGRVYAIGDIHGRFDLLVRMLHAIGEDMRRHPVGPCRIVFLGDLIDRGPQSSKVLELTLALSRQTKRVRFLRGNHEALLLRALTGDASAAEFFYDIGGKETLQSYGLDEKVGDTMSGDLLIGWMRENIPSDHIAFIESFDDLITSGNYIFVHAGIRPGVSLDEQLASDLHWIRTEFTNYSGSHPGIVIHGHSVTRTVEEKSNRIGIDTGAYFSGILSAVVMEENRRWYITATAEGWEESEQEKEFSYLFE
jgi:serine/threonine protein phosphatase 1